MLTFLFWNMGGDQRNGADASIIDKRHARLLRIVANLVHRHEVDLLLLAECPVDPGALLKGINHANPVPFHEPAGTNCSKIIIFPRFPRRFISMRGASESGDYTCRHVRLPGRIEFILFVAHLGSKLWNSDESQTLAAPGVSSVIREMETRAQHQRTVVVGDMNMNPFDAGIVGAEGLNAVMTRELALRESRTIAGRPYPFFYNPMWSHFGDATHDVYPPGDPNHDPAGTCYYPAGESRWYFWHMFDQVLLRPALLPFFKAADLRILPTDGTTNLLNTRGLPNRNTGSDHLPLVFSLSL